MPLAKTSLFFTFTLLTTFPALAEAAKSPLELAVGDRVLVVGSLHRKCSAKIVAVPSPGFANLQFDRAGCGDASVAFELRHLQRILFQDRSHELAAGDTVVVKGYFNNECSGKLREISRSGYASVDLDSLLCADTVGLFKYQDVQKVQYVSATAVSEKSFSVGQKVSTPGIHEGDVCRGEIRKLTDTGLAAVAFEEQTCAYDGKMYSVEDLKALKEKAPRRHASGEVIFQRVMREIASQKKVRKHASL